MEVGMEKIVSRLQYLCAFAFAPTFPAFLFPAGAFVSIADRTELREGSSHLYHRIRTQYICAGIGCERKRKLG